MRQWWMWILCAVLVGCGGQTVAPTITPRPTLTVTPLSTPLSYLPTPEPSGSVDNPFQMVLVPANSARARTIRTEFEQALTNLTEVNVRVVLAQRDTEAVNAVCDVLNGVTLAWVDSLGYAQAQARGCGVPLLRLAPSRNRFGEASVIVYAPTIEGTALGDIVGADFCRLGVDDLYSWLLPSLVMRSVGISPDRLDDVRDYADNTAILEALQAGECDATAFNASEFDALVEANDPLVADLSVSTSSPELPTRILLVSPLLPQSARDALVEALVEWRDEDLLEPLIGAGDLLRVEAGDFDPLNDFFRATGYDFSTIGQ